MLGARTIGAVAFAAACMIAMALQPSSARPIPRSLTITRHPGAASEIDDRAADHVLAAASRLLQTDDGPARNKDGDVRCEVALVRAGPVATFGSSVLLDGILGSESDFIEVCKQDGHIHVVNQILWCGDEPTESLIACTEIGKRCIVVVRPSATFTDTQEPVLWAHEYGHSRGLTHSCKGNCTSNEDDRVMHPVIVEPHVKIGARECKAYVR